MREGQNRLSLISFLIGILCFLRFQVVGEVYVSEILLAGLLPFLLITRNHLLRNPTALAFLGLIGLWLSAQILTDIVRETDFLDYSRGWANIAAFMVNACALYLLLQGSRRRFVLFALGLALGKLLSFWLAPTLFADTYPWKFGIGNGVALLAVLAGLWRPIRWNPILATAPLLAVGAYSLVVGFRSMFACALLASLALFAQGLLCLSPRGSRVKPAFLVTGWLACSLLAGLGVLELYKLAASEGYMDEVSTATFALQNQGDLGVLIGGRIAVFSSIPAILDSPILGHGSKAKDPYYAGLILEGRNYGYEIGMGLHHSYQYESRIPTHSMLLGTWVQAGIGGVFFWICFALLIVATLANLGAAREPLSLLIFYLGFAQLWHIPFSPFAGEHRLMTAFTLCLFVAARQVLRNSGSAISGVAPPVPHGKPRTYERLRG